MSHKNNKSQFKPHLLEENQSPPVKKKKHARINANIIKLAELLQEKKYFFKRINHNAILLTSENIGEDNLAYYISKHTVTIRINACDLDLYDFNEDIQPILKFIKDNQDGLKGS